MFIQNKYFHWYYKLIETRKNLVREEYTEKHHIIPRSLGGSNKKENLVRLTAREHFIAHLLLVFFTEGSDNKKMLKAFTMMSSISENQDRIRFTSRLYSKLKICADDVRREYKHTDEAKRRIREYQTGRSKAPFSQEHLRKMSESRKGKEPWNKGRRGDKASQAIKDKMKKTRSALKFKLSDEGAEKISTRAKLYIVCYDKYYMQNVSILRTEFSSNRDRYITHRSNEYKRLRDGKSNIVQAG